jgi:hypothetical protein
MAKIEPPNYVLQASGNSNPITNPGKVAQIDSAVKNQQLAQASAQAQSVNNNTASNTDAGYEQFRDYSQGEYGPGAPPPDVKTDLNRLIPEGSEYGEFKTVGTSVNYINPLNKRGPLKTTLGTPSLFNDYWLVSYQTVKDRIGGPKRPSVTNLGDEQRYKGLGDHEAYKNPTTSKIIEVFNGQNPDSFYAWPEKKYKYSDFLYLKHYHPYNNNRLITLRRFMTPVYDNCRSAIRTEKTEEGKLRAPIARALSYLGTSDNKLSGLMNFTVTIKNKETTGNQSDKPTKISASEFADVGQFFGGSKGSTQDEASFAVSLIKAISGSTDFDKDAQEKWATAMNLWENGPYEDLINGPVNVIIGARIRDRGLTYTQTLNINFEYSTKYIERINPKAAMLDILSNMLSLTYHHANFYGGENRVQFEDTNFAFLKNEKEMDFLKALKKGGTTESLKQYADELKLTGSNAAGNISALIEAFRDGGLKTEDPGFKKLIQQTGTAMVSLNKNLRETNKSLTQGTKGILNGSPTGSWHLQIGNPFSPIAMIGNLWCKQATFTFNDDLSADDFPTELKVSIGLDLGRQRDSSDIQSMFNAGGGRIYYPYQDKADTNASSTFFNTEYAYIDKPSVNKDAYQTVNTIESANIPNEKTDDLKTKLEPKFDKTTVNRAIFMPQNQEQVEADGNLKKGPN